MQRQRGNNQCHFFPFVDLQYLNIEAIEPDWNATDDIFDHFIFPELRYLDLEIMDNGGVSPADPLLFLPFY